MKKADELRKLVDAAHRAAHGDSNDAEIEALQDALEAALVRWPEITTEECSQCQPGHDRGDGRCERHGKRIPA